MKSHMIEERDKYLLEFFKNREANSEHQYCEVYLDKSYIHQHYQRFDKLIWDPKDKQDLQCKSAHKGKRYCFIAAIQGPSPTDKTLKGDFAGLVSGSFWQFCPNQGAQTNNYHKAFNSSNFTAWWKEKLFTNLHERSIIIMDNAKYHLGYSESVPKPDKMKKCECISYLEAKKN